MLPTSKAKGVLFLASSLWDGLEDNNIEQIKILLENNGADPNVLLPGHGITPFHMVIGNESESFAERVIKLFLRHGGNANVISDDGMTPVHVAAAWGRVKILELLLTNGGDPLYMDDYGKTPFHYAFDGSYYEAITVLGKYCTKIQNADCEDDDDVNEPKVQMKLEKILVNRGDIVAEYVPSEVDLTTNAQCETQDNIVSIKNSNYFSSNNFECTDEMNRKLTNIHLSPNNTSLIPYNNIRHHKGRKYTAKHKEISPILPVDNYDFEVKEKNSVENNVLNDQIIDEYSNSIVISNKKSNSINALKDTEKNKNSMEFCNLLLKRKYHKNRLNSEEKAIQSELFDTSILTTSPNFKLPIRKKISQTRPISWPKNDSPNWTKKQFNPKITNVKSTTTPSSPTVTPKKSSINSTPSRQTNQCNYDVKKRSPNTKIDSTPRRATYAKNNYDKSFSHDVKNITTRKNLFQPIKKERNEIYLDPSNNNETEWKQLNVESKSPSVRSKFTKLFTNVETKTLVGINKVKSAVQQITHKPKNIKCIELDENVPVDNENNETFLESAESSFVASPSYQGQSIKSEHNSHDELEFWNELNEIHKHKGKSPPASISKYINDANNSTNKLKTSPSAEKKEFSFSLDDFAEQQNIDHCIHNSEINESNNTEVFKTPLRSTIGSRASIESFMSIDEEYAYVDAEKDVAFMERRLRVLPKIKNLNCCIHESTSLHKYGSDLSPNATSERSQRVSEIFMSHSSLREKLIAIGEIPGPITDTTHNVYLKRLYKLKCEKSTNFNQCFVTSKSKSESSIVKSPIIPKTLLVADFITNSQFYRNLEDLAFSEYEEPRGHKKYRGGIARTSFNYLLLDPRVTNDLPRNGGVMCLDERWKIFLQAIFYIGKGKNSRPFAHLYESHKIWTGKIPNDESNEKVQRILDIWREKKGVVCHQVFINCMQEEAFTREAAMIDALGTKHLSNCNRGNYYGLATTMSNDEKQALGKYLLYKSMEILMHDGERQQFPRNLE